MAYVRKILKNHQRSSSVPFFPSYVDVTSLLKPNLALVKRPHSLLPCCRPSTFRFEKHKRLY